MSRARTATSNFGVGRREAHDAAAFYARFAAPELSREETVPAPGEIAEPFVHGDARELSTVASGSVALVVTSPPYFAGKRYEEELDRAGVPGSYLEYLDLLRDVFAECKRVLEPGGRIAVNVANLGRKPYRSLAADVVRILQDDLHLLLRGEVVWQKGEGASGSCAWGSFRSPANPVLRDVTERIVIASKGRFDRARSARRRAVEGLPHEATVSADEFMAATLDVWDIPPESARRVGHPAPFPIELPERLIGLYTYAEDLVLDPFMGAGTTLVAAARLGRRFVGYDLEQDYVELARRRVEAELDRLARTGPPAATPGGTFAAVAEQVVTDAGFCVVGRQVRLRGSGVEADLVATDGAGTRWYFDLTGGYTTTRTGLSRTETTLRALGRAHVFSAKRLGPLVLLSATLPPPGSDADRALRTVGPTGFFDAIELDDDGGTERLRTYAKGHATGRPLAGFWREGDLAG